MKVWLVYIFAINNTVLGLDPAPAVCATKRLALTLACSRIKGMLDKVGAAAANNIRSLLQAEHPTDETLEKVISIFNANTDPWTTIQIRHEAVLGEEDPSNLAPVVEGQLSEDKQRVIDGEEATLGMLLV